VYSSPGLFEATGVLEQNGKVVTNLSCQERLAREPSLADRERCPERADGGLGVAPETATGSVVTEPAYDNACERDHESFSPEAASRCDSTERRLRTQRPKE
jgi:hypothetical protein